LHLGKQMLHDFGRADVVDTAQFMKGLKAGLAGERTLDDAAIKEAIIAYRIDVIKEDAARFLEANKKKEGVKTTASGLQYEVLKAGDPGGKQPKLMDKVKVHYTGTLVNGTKFDSSVDSGEPFDFELKGGPGGVIAGWVEGLQLMHVGDKFRLFIPPELGYGAKGSPPKVPGHAVLVFEIELLDVK
jgi:FKBP-type peptidyl-prolyl cis-trans isomerase FklB